MSLGVAPSYQSFLGLTEVLSGILLLYRKTVSIASFITIIFLGNVFVSNIAYEGSEQVYSLHLISIAIFLLMYDGQRLFRLLILQHPTVPNRFKPLLAFPWQRYARIALKTFFGFFFVVLYGFKVGKDYQKGAYLFPQTAGLPSIAGLYNVTAFSLNNNKIAYSTSDPARWQDVVFEEWNTISILSNRPVFPHKNSVENINDSGAERTYELEGSAARHYYSYETDTLQHILILHNRNAHYAGETRVLHYDRPSPSSIILKGTNQYNDSITIILDKIDKKYLLREAAQTGRISGLKL